MRRYMPPEVLKEEGPFAFFATDIWSLGVILYEATFGEKFLGRIEGNDRSLFYQALNSFFNLKDTIDLEATFSGYKLCFSHQTMLEGFLRYDYRTRLNFKQMELLLNSTWDEPEKDSEGKKSLYSVPDVTFGSG
ncbi:unnamed protein product, partial [Mesorhabditis belari]|uniref:Protein kinase domain-containing protein n=1 Tax=Mesorhabditis belari TaxID=2138241 RepID=A0AAF3J5N0_9BILA